MRFSFSRTVSHISVTVRRGATLGTTCKQNERLLQLIGYFFYFVFPT